MVHQPAPLKENDIKYIKNWMDQYNVGDTFTLKRWKSYYQGNSNAPKTTTVGRQVVAALEGTPPDPRLDFIELTQGPGKGGKPSPKTSTNAQYFKKIK